jgi:hypothetical protein
MKKRKFLGFRAKTLDVLGQVLEYTDPMKTRESALRYIKKHMTWLSWGGRNRYVAIQVVRVYKVN